MLRSITGQNLRSWRLVVLSVLIGTLTGCGTLAGVHLRDTEQASNGCNVTLGVYNGTGVPWTGASYLFVFRDTNNAAVGQLQAITDNIYVEPKKGFGLAKEIRNVSCERIAKFSVEYFGYYPVSGNQIPVPTSSVKTKFKAEPAR